MKQINVALIGLGYWGSKHLDFYKKREDVEVKYLCDINSNENLILKNYKDINLEQIDFIDIVTPEETHFEIANYFLSKGKYVFLEKPICLENKHLIKLINNNFSNLLMVGYLYNFDEALNYFYNDLFPKINKIRNIKLLWKDKLNIVKNCSIISDLAPHIFSILLKFSNNINILESYFQKSIKDAKITGNISINQNLIPFEIVLDWDSKDKIRSLIIEDYNNSYETNFVSQKIYCNSKEFKRFNKYYNLDVELSYFINLVKNNKKIDVNSTIYSKKIFDLSNISDKLYMNKIKNKIT